MRKGIALGQFYKGFLMLLAFAIASCSSADKTCQSSELHTLSVQAIDQAVNIYAAQSALEAIQRGDSESAKVILESQVQQGLVILRTTRPELVSGKALSEQDRKIIDDAMQNAEKYAREHKLEVPSP